MMWGDAEMGELVTIGNVSMGCQAYLARPRLEPAPAALIFHAWWGLNAFIQQLSDRLCDEGFVVLAPGYYRGKVAASTDQAQVLKSQMDRSRAYALAKQALEQLLAYDFVLPKQVATIGLSLGCGPALELARSKPDTIRAVVLFYGTGGGKFDAAQADFLGHFAEDDQWGAHAKKVAALKERLSKSSGTVEFYTYSQTKHWFFESDRVDAYNEEAAQTAWNRTIRFLKEG
jgi:carboxymethylenebutenolidase